MKLSRRLPVLILCVLLLLSALTGCDRPGGPDDTGGTGSTDSASPPDSGPDAEALVSDAVRTTAAELKARIEGSRLGALLRFLEQENVAAEFSLGLPDDAGDNAVTVTGTMEMNRSAGTALTDLTLSGADEKGGEITLPLKFWYSPSFLGMGSELFGNDTFYGLAPQNMASQLEGTEFAELFSLDEQALEQADEFLASVPGNVGVFKAGFLDGMQSSLLSLLKDRALTAKKSELSHGGQTFEGYAVTASLTAQEAGQLVADAANLLPEAVLLYGIVSQDERVLTVSDHLDTLRTGASGATLELDVADGRLIRFRLSFSLNGGTSTVEGSLYGEDDRSVSVQIQDLLDFTLTLDSDLHFDMVTHSDMPTVTNFDWKAGGELYLMAYTNDVTDLCLDGTAQAQEDSLRFEGIWYSGERGDQNLLSFTAGPGEAPTAPSNTKNVADMSGSELYKLVSKLLFNGLFGE